MDCIGRYAMRDLMNGQYRTIRRVHLSRSQRYATNEKRHTDWGRGWPVSLVSGQLSETPDGG